MPRARGSSLFYNGHDKASGTNRIDHGATTAFFVRDGTAIRTNVAVARDLVTQAFWLARTDLGSGSELNWPRPGLDGLDS